MGEDRGGDAWGERRGSQQVVLTKIVVKSAKKAQPMLKSMEIMNTFPSAPTGLVEFISHSIEKSGHCTIRDGRILGLLMGSRKSDEGRLRRLRLFARQHDWVVASHFGHAAVFTHRLERRLSPSAPDSLAIRNEGGKAPE